MDVLSRVIAKKAVPSDCQICDCVAEKSGLGQPVCKACSAPSISYWVSIIFANQFILHFISASLWIKKKHHFVLPKIGTKNLNYIFKIDIFSLLTETIFSTQDGGWPVRGRSERISETTRQGDQEGNACPQACKKEPQGQAVNVHRLHLLWLTNHNLPWTMFFAFSEHLGWKNFLRSYVQSSHDYYECIF